MVAGIGPGNPKYLTMEVREAIEKFERVVAFGRVSNSIKHIRKDFIKIHKVTHINKLIKEHKNLLILASGDPCFYGIVEYLKKENIAIERIMPGLSSFQYMTAKLGIGWQGANLLSLHGRKENLDTVKDHRLSIILTDKDNTPSNISKWLYRIKVKGTIYAGFNLSYEDERIVKARIGETIEDISPLAVVVIENEMD